MATAIDFLSRCNALMGGQSPALILFRAKEILSAPEQWTNRARALNDRGERVRPEDPAAVCWNVNGAVSLSCNKYGIFPPYFVVLLDEVAREIAAGCGLAGLTGLIEFEESFEHEDVIELLQIAVERTQQSG